ncbi:MAG: glycerophosphodiester phosphodiesterase [Acidimicrobiia bacterium]
MRPITFAHRGARSERPENTLAAFERALELGATGLESDAHLSHDGEVVLVHDRVVRDGLRRRRVAQSDARDLARLGIPRLADLYAELGTDYELSLDLKDDAVVERLLGVADGAGATERLWLCSGRVPALQQIRELATPARLVHSTKRSALGSSVERHADQLVRARIDACNMRHTDWTAGLVGLFHRFGVRAFAWGAQEVRHVRAMLDVGVDGLYSDHVDRLVATVAEWS